MKEHKRFLLCLLALAMALTACGGGGGGDGAGNGTTTPPPPDPVAGTDFNIVPLAGLGGVSSAGITVNNLSMAVGIADDGPGIKAVKWDLAAPGSVVKLAPLAGAGYYSAAYGINDPGVAVGESITAGGAIVAVQWPAGLTTPTALNTTGLAGGNSAAYGINNDNKIVGEAADDLGNPLAVFWNTPAAAPVVLAGLNGNQDASAYFISNGNVIVGESRNSAGKFQAVVWLPTGNGYGNPVPLAVLGDQISSVAFGVDTDGRIVGEAELATGIVHGVVWNTSGAIVEDIGANTSAQAISQGSGTGRIVGFTGALSGSDRSVMWNLFNFLEKQEFEPFSQAYGVNDSFSFVGQKDNQAVAGIPL
jgi:hypothetical protein